MTQETKPSYKVIFTARDAATAETRAKSEDSLLRVLNSYIQSFAIRDPAFYINMPASYTEYLCQLAYEGPPVDGVTPRSTVLAERIGAADIEKLHTTGKGLIATLTGKQCEKADALVRRNMTRELLRFHSVKMKRKEYPHNPVTRGLRRPFKYYLDDACFTVIIPRKHARSIVWDDAAQCTRFRSDIFSDSVKLEGINLTRGHDWHHLRLYAIKSWMSEISEWRAELKNTDTYYIREQR